MYQDRLRTKRKENAKTDGKRVCVSLTMDLPTCSLRARPPSRSSRHASRSPRRYGGSPTYERQRKTEQTKQIRFFESSFIVVFVPSLASQLLVKSSRLRRENGVFNRKASKVFAPCAMGLRSRIRPASCTCRRDRGRGPHARALCSAGLAGCGRLPSGPRGGPGPCAKRTKEDTNTQRKKRARMRPLRESD
jgi:hypothetical protein